MAKVWVKGHTRNGKKVAGHWRETGWDNANDRMAGRKVPYSVGDYVDRTQSMRWHSGKKKIGGRAMYNRARGVPGLTGPLTRKSVVMAMGGRPSRKR